ncbi:MAG TPA: NADP-dependent phosphogluconate dehydrogenase, partial [Gammaproteobacteria bacterium]|nr:NADP-dependent phosphogluconate dehydrogenase [Gammaproteobacteria bacterium]
GLGVMGNNLLLNMADHGFVVAGYDKDPKKVEDLRIASQKQSVHNTADVKAFIKLLRRPRAVLLLVPAGPIVDSVIEDLLPNLEAGDLIIDAGNSYFKDTELRTKNLMAKGFQFMGIGISGGEEGARHGPSIMPGGSKEAYDRIHTILEAIAAKVDGKPCVTYLGSGASGHFVKMVHNGIEYGIMQLISETYDLMKRGLGLQDAQLHDIYSEWNKGELNSYLIEITSKIFDKVDNKTGKKLINIILDVAKQNGTGMWTTQSAMELQVPVPTIDAAVAQRDLSVFIKERLLMSAAYKQPVSNLPQNHQQLISDLRQALFAGILIVFVQGMALLRAASDKYEYNLDLEAIARIWRGGCIIRASLLEDICIAFHQKSDLSNLMLDANLHQKLMANQECLRKCICKAVEFGIPIPGLMSSLSYFDAYRSNWLPMNLVQAQRDYFGAHRYERNDMKGTFHTKWEEE